MLLWPALQGEFLATGPPGKPRVGPLELAHSLERQTHPFTVEAGCASADEEGEAVASCVCGRAPGSCIVVEIDFYTREKDGCAVRRQSSD